MLRSLATVFTLCTVSSGVTMDTWAGQRLSVRDPNTLAPRTPSTPFQNNLIVHSGAECRWFQSGQRALDEKDWARVAVRSN